MCQIRDVISRLGDFLALLWADREIDMNYDDISCDDVRAKLNPISFDELFANRATEATDEPDALTGFIQCENSSGAEVHKEPNSAGIVLLQETLEAVEICCSMWIKSNGWRLKEEGYERGDIVNECLKLILAGKAKQGKGIDHSLTVKHAAEVLLRSQFCGKDAGDDTSFRRTRTDSKANSYKEASADELAEVSLTGIRSNTPKVGGSVSKSALAMTSRQSKDATLRQVQVEYGRFGSAEYMQDQVEYMDLLDVLAMEQGSELAEILRLSKQGYTLADIAGLFGCSVSTASRKRKEALDAFNELSSRESKNFLQRQIEAEAARNQRANQIEKARKQHSDRLARAKQLRQWAALKSMKNGLRRKSENVCKQYAA